MSKQKLIYRQGDIILEKIDKLPKDAKPAGNSLSLTGETGNAHVLEAPVFETGIQTFVQIGAEGAMMKHAEHPTQPIEKGNYVVRRLREYVEKERPRAVFD